MSLLLQIAIPVLIAAGIGFGAWKHHENTVAHQAPQEQHDATGVRLNTTLQAGTTNEDLQKDMSTIDTNINATESASVDIDNGLNDKQIPQE